MHLTRLRAVLAVFISALMTPILLGFSFNALKAKEELPIGKSPRFEEAFRILEQSKAGNALLREARKKWKFEDNQDLISMLRWGKVSKTDAVLTRQLDVETGKEVHSRVITVFIKRNQNLNDLVLDLAHELTHAIHGPAWNPYDPNLTAARYIRLAIEGKGGEVDALYTECLVARELEAQFRIPSKRCKTFEIKKSGMLSRGKIKREFYKVGKYKKSLQKVLKTRAFRLTRDVPTLISSTGNAPYPMALLREFEELTRVACANTQRRLASLEKTKKPKTRKSKSFLAKRCKDQIGWNQAHSKNP